MKKHKKLLFILIPVLLVVIIAVAVIVGKAGSKGSVTEPTLSLREAEKSASAVISKGGADKSKVLNEHYLIAENDGYELYLKEDRL